MANPVAPVIDVRGGVRHVAEAVFQALPRRTHLGDRLVLAYHNIVPDGVDQAGDRSLHLGAERFIRQLDLIRRDSEIVPLMDLLTAPGTRSRLVAITFDDAYASALQLGVAYLAAMGIPCTVFVAPGLLGTVPPWDSLASRGEWTDADRRRFLWDQHGRAPAPAGTEDATAHARLLKIATAGDLRAASRSGVAFGNHTMTHPNLAALEPSAAQAEIAAADAWLRGEYPDRHIPVVAYPYGLAPTDTAATRPTAAMDFGLLVTGGWIRKAEDLSPYAVPRWNVPAGISDAGFSTRLRGWLSQR